MECEEVRKREEKRVRRVVTITLVIMMAIITGVLTFMSIVFKLPSFLFDLVGFLCVLIMAPFVVLIITHYAPKSFMQVDGESTSGDFPTEHDSSIDDE